MLFDRGLLVVVAECLDVGGDAQWLDVGELAEPVLLAPARNRVTAW